MSPIKRPPTGHRCGESHPKARLTDEQVEQIRIMRDNGKSYGQIAKAMNCPYWTARDIADYRTRL